MSWSIDVQKFWRIPSRLIPPKRRLPRTPSPPEAVGHPSVSGSSTRGCKKRRQNSAPNPTPVWPCSQMTVTGSSHLRAVSSSLATPAVAPLGMRGQENVEWSLCLPRFILAPPAAVRVPVLRRAPLRAKVSRPHGKRDVKMVGDIHPCILSGECFSHRLDVGPLPLSDSLCSPSGTSPDSLSGLGVLQSPIPSRGLSHSPVSAHGVSCSSSSSPSFPVRLRSRSASPPPSSPACTRRSLVFSCPVPEFFSPRPLPGFKPLLRGHRLLLPLVFDMGLPSNVYQTTQAR